MTSNTDTIEITHNSWTNQDLLHWQDSHQLKRDYHTDIISPVLSLRNEFDIQRYGALRFDIDRYPLYAVKNKNWSTDNPIVLISAGVHGCETSGIQAMIRFLKHKIHRFTSQFNFICAVCVSPWSYETNNRWNPTALDPNRQFFQNTLCDEASNLMHLIDPFKNKIIAHFDLHDTTPSNEAVFQAEYAQKYGIRDSAHPLPDGSILIGDIDAPKLAFQAAMIRTLKCHTPLAKPDDDNKILGQPVVNEGVILYSKTALRLCTGYTPAPFKTVIKTLVDDQRLSPEVGITAQLETLTTGLKFILTHR